ncbi:integrase core domain-containing protein [Snodgrassella sp. ESL0253]|nr:integrase core domain-containing protein [Snodgrassella sp. ESL0253]NUE65634.1 transposase [Snodgrassella sp. ESL0253]
MIFYVSFVLTMGYLQTEEWLTIYNTERPHEALNNMTPIEYKTLKQAA